MNTLWLCTCNQEKIVVRVNPDKATPFADRDLERKIVQFLADRQLGPAYHGAFQNGIIYDYTEGENPTAEDMRNPDVMR